MEGYIVKMIIGSSATLVPLILWILRTKKILKADYWMNINILVLLLSIIIFFLFSALAFTEMFIEMHKKGIPIL